MGLKSFCSQSCKNHNDAFLYCLLFNSFVLINKYVLSTVGFRFAAVLQGCQTLVSSVYLLSLKRSHSGAATTSATRHATHLHLHRSLPDLLLFIIVILTGSKALASVPVPLVLSVQNVPVLCYLILSLYKVPVPELLVALTGLSSSLALLLVRDQHVTEDGMFWLTWHCVSSMIFETYFQTDDSPHKEISNNFYRNMISGVALLVWSVVLSEEGRLAAGFRADSDAWLLSGCATSAVLCSLLHGLTVRSRFTRAAALQVVSRLPALVLSVHLFPEDHLSLLTWNFIAVNMSSTLLLSLSTPHLPGNMETPPPPSTSTAVTLTV